MSLHATSSFHDHATTIINIFSISEKWIDFFLINHDDDLKSQSSLAQWPICPFRFLGCTRTVNNFGNPKWRRFWGFAFIWKKRVDVWWLVFLEIFWGLEVFSHGEIKREKEEREGESLRKRNVFFLFSCRGLNLY